MSSPTTSQSLRPLALAAMGSAAVMMAYQVASRATRDTLFLTSFHFASLPLMVTAASVVSIAAAVLATRAMATLGPARFVPMAFLASAVLTLAEWALAVQWPDIGAIAVYLHVAAFGPVLISGFWGIINERFDPRTAKRAIGRIAGIGTLGGIVGGVLAERLTAWTGTTSALPAMALAHAWCAWSVSRLPPPLVSAVARPTAQEPLAAREAHRRLLSTPYLRNLALLVLGSSVSAALLDFVFKAQTSGVARQSLDLMRVFSAFYTIVALFTFALQALVSRLALERAGLARTIGTLPGAVVAGGSLAMLVPGPWSVSLARGLESVMRGSLFRAGYELLYNPIPEAEKRATKTVVDVGCDRLGEAVGAGITVLVLMLVPASTTPVLLGISVLLAAAILGLVGQLQRGYVSSLEAGLRAGAVDLDPQQIEDVTTRNAIQRTLGRITPGPEGDLGLSRALGFTLEPDPGTFVTPRPAKAEVSDAAVAADVIEALHTLRSGDAARVRAALRAAVPPDPVLVPQLIVLLAWDDVAEETAEALKTVAVRHVGQLVDALLDPDSDFAVRRRIPSVFAASPTSRAVEGLMRGLADSRFEVRYRCGRALARMVERESSLDVDRELILGAVRREATVGRHVWESQRLLDRLEERSADAFVDDFLRDRAGRSLEHVFTLLSLVLPREPLQIAFRGLYAGDRILHGTALEYLESVLPPSVREVLWPYLEPNRTARRADAAAPPRDREQVLKDLLRSNESIEINLEELRRKHREGTDVDGT